MNWIVSVLFLAAILGVVLWLARRRTVGLALIFPFALVAAAFLIVYLILTFGLFFGDYGQ